MEADVIDTDQLVTSTDTRVMSCPARIVVAHDADLDGGTLLRSGVERLQQLEQRWSRFLVTSEIAHLNAADGLPCSVSTDTVRLVEAMVQAWHATDGAFDPTLVGALVELGYSSSRDDATLRTSIAAGIQPQGRPAEILVDARNRVVQLPAGTALDPGGLGKGLAADIVSRDLCEAGATGALIEIGGDVAVSGIPPRSAHWSIAIDGDLGEVVRLTAGAVATSTTRLRTWRTDNGDRHHLLDPSSRSPTSNDVVSSTVIAGSGAWAEAFTKLAFVRGCTEALDRCAARGLAASITLDDGSRRTTAAWKSFAS